MTNPLDESRPLPTQRSLPNPLPIRTIAIADDDGVWRVEVDIDDDREPHEAPTDVRLAIVTTDACTQVPLPVETLRELQRVIGELLTDQPPELITPASTWADVDAQLERQRAERRRRPPRPAGDATPTRTPDKGENE